MFACSCFDAATNIAHPIYHSNTQRNNNDKKKRNQQRKKNDDVYPNEMMHRVVPCIIIQTDVRAAMISQTKELRQNNKQLLCAHHNNPDMCILFSFQLPSQKTLLLKMNFFSLFGFSIKFLSFGLCFGLAQTVVFLSLVLCLICCCYIVVRLD